MSSSGCWRRFSPRRFQLGNIVTIFLALALAWQAPAPVLAQVACGDYAVAVEPQTPGQPLTGNAVSLMTPAGEVVQGAFQEPGTVKPSPKPGVALVRSLGGIYALLDVTTGTIQPLQIPEKSQRRLSDTFQTVRNADVANFMLLAEPPFSVWLIDLATGDAVDLTTLGDGEQNFIESAAISSDGNWLIYSVQLESFLVSLESPGQPQPLDTEPILQYPKFDEQSNVIYAVEGDAMISIRSLNPSTGTRTEIAVTPRARSMPIQHPAQLLLLTEDELLTVQGGAMSPTTLFSFMGGVEQVLADSSGTHVVIGDEIDDVTSWYWVDVSTGQQTELSELKGMFATSGPASKRDAVLFVPSLRIEPGTPGAPFKTLDLTTGTVRTVLEQDSDDVWQVFPGGDTAGRNLMVNAIRPGIGRIWLVDTLGGNATLIGTSAGNVKAAVSPDGCLVAVGIFDTLGEGRVSSVTVTSLVDGTTTMEIPNAILLGWSEAA